MPTLLRLNPESEIIISEKKVSLKLTNVTSASVAWKLSSSSQLFTARPSSGILDGGEVVTVRCEANDGAPLLGGGITISAVANAVPLSRAAWRAREWEVDIHRLAVKCKGASQAAKIAVQILEAVEKKDQCALKALLRAHRKLHETVLASPIGKTTLFSHIDTKFDLAWAHLLLVGHKEDTHIALPAPSCVKCHPEHLSLGITAVGFERILERFGFWQDGGQINEPIKHRVVRSLTFVDQFSADVATGYDLQKAIVDEFERQGLEDFSLCELMASLNHPDVGVADRLLSHAQQEPLFVTLDAMKRHEVQEGRVCVFFVDFPTLRQCRSDFKMEKVDAALARMSAIVLVLSPLASPQTLTRIFCLFEVGAAFHHGLRFEVVLPETERLRLHEVIAAVNEGTSELVATLGAVSMEDATIRPGQEAVKDEILQKIEDTTTIREANLRVGALILSGAARLACQTSDGSKTALARFLTKSAEKVRGLHGPLLPDLLRMTSQGWSVFHLACDHAATLGKLLELAEEAGVSREILKMKDPKGRDATAFARANIQRRSLTFLEDAVGLALNPKFQVVFDERQHAQLTLINRSAQNMAFDVSDASSGKTRFDPPAGILQVGERVTLDITRKQAKNWGIAVKHVATKSLSALTSEQWALQVSSTFESRISTEQMSRDQTGPDWTGPDRTGHNQQCCIF